MTMRAGSQQVRCNPRTGRPRSGPVRRQRARRSRHRHPARPLPRRLRHTGPGAAGRGRQAGPGKPPGSTAERSRCPRWAWPRPAAAVRTGRHPPAPRPGIPPSAHHRIAHAPAPVAAKAVFSAGSSTSPEDSSIRRHRFPAGIAGHQAVTAARLQYDIAFFDTQPVMQLFVKAAPSATSRKEAGEGGCPTSTTCVTGRPGAGRWQRGQRVARHPRPQYGARAARSLMAAARRAASDRRYAR